MPNGKRIAGRCRCRGDIGESAFALIVDQQINLFVMGTRIGLLNVGVDVPIGDKQIEPAIVVVVEKAPSEAQERPRGTS